MCSVYHGLRSPVHANPHLGYEEQYHPPAQLTFEVTPSSCSFGTRSQSTY